jgi:hypothetical protein
VICEPTRSKWWSGCAPLTYAAGSNRRSPRIQDRLIGVRCGKWHVRSGSGGRGVRERMPAGSVPRIARRLRGKTKNKKTSSSPWLVPAKGNKSLVPRRWCPVGTKKKKEKGRFGVGAGLRGQILDRPPILRGPVGPSKAPLTYRPTPPVPRSRGPWIHLRSGSYAAGIKEKRKGQVRGWGGASRSDPRSAADPQGTGRTE